jgi:hypothetical protein
MVLLAAGTWIYRFARKRSAEDRNIKTVKLDLRFTAPIGYDVRTGKSAKGDDRPATKVAHTNFNVRMGTPPRIAGLPRDAAHGVEEIFFKSGRQTWTFTSIGLRAVDPHAQDYSSAKRCDTKDRPIA